MFPGTLLGTSPISSLLLLTTASAVVDVSDAIDDPLHLIEAEVYQGGGTLNLPPMLIGNSVISGFPFGSASDAGTANLKYSDWGWIGEPADPDKPNELYLGRAITPFEFERTSPVLPESTARLQAQYGQIVLAGGDGDLDTAVRSWAIAGRPVTVRRGARSVPIATPYADHAVVLSALATGWRQDEDRVTIDLRDTAYRLEAPLQTLLYAGTGDAEGDAQFAGKPKPIGLGKNRNVTPDFVDKANNVFCFGFRKSRAVLAARDQGQSLIVDGDHADYASLIGASLSGGHAVTCLALSLIRTATTPVALTLDFEGDADGVYTDTHAGMARKVLELAGLSNAEYVYASFGDWPSGTAGVYFGSDEAVKAADAMGRIAASIAGWWGPRRDGRIVGGQLFDPATLSPDLYVDLSRIAGGVEQLPVSALPRYRQRVGYQALETVQDGANLATDPSIDRQYYGQPYRTVTAIDASIQSRYPLAEDFPPLVSLFDGDAEAQTLADTLLGLHKHDRRMFRVPLGAIGFLIDLGSVVHLTYPRFGLDGGKPFVVVGLAEDATGSTATIWG